MSLVWGDELGFAPIGTAAQAAAQDTVAEELIYDGQGHVWDSARQDWNNLDGTPYDPNWNQPAWTPDSSLPPPPPPPTPSAPLTFGGPWTPNSTLPPPMPDTSWNPDSTLPPPLPSPPPLPPEDSFSPGNPWSPMPQQGVSADTFADERTNAFRDWFSTPLGLSEYLAGERPGTRSTQLAGMAQAAMQPGALTASGYQQDDYGAQRGLPNDSTLLDYAPGLIKAATTSVLPSSWLDKLPDQWYMPVRQVAEGVTSPLGAALLPVGGGGSGVLANVGKNILGYAGAVAADEATQNMPDWGIGVAKVAAPALSALLGHPKIALGLGAAGLALPNDTYRSLASQAIGGVLGYESPAIARAAATVAPGIARNVGGALREAAPLLREEYGAMVHGGGGPFEPGARVTDPTGKLFTVIHDDPGLSTRVVDDLGRESTITSGMLLPAVGQAAGGAASWRDDVITALREHQSNQSSGARGLENVELRARQAAEFDARLSEAVARGDDPGEALRYAGAGMAGGAERAGYTALPPTVIDPLETRVLQASLANEINPFETTQAQHAVDQLAIDGNLSHVTPSRVTLLRRILGDDIVAALDGDMSKLKVEGVPHAQPTRPLPGFEEMTPRVTAEGKPLPGAQGMEPLMGGESALELHLPDILTPEQMARRDVLIAEQRAVTNPVNLPTKVREAMDAANSADITAARAEEIAVGRARPVTGSTAAFDDVLAKAQPELAVAARNARTRADELQAEYERLAGGLAKPEPTQRPLMPMDAGQPRDLTLNPAINEIASKGATGNVHEWDTPTRPSVLSNEGANQLTPLGHVLDLLNVPRHIMTIWDASGTLRQGVILAAGHPLQTAEAFVTQVKAMSNLDRAVQALRDYRGRQFYAEGKAAGLKELEYAEKTRIAAHAAEGGAIASHPLVTAAASERPEGFGSLLAQRFPGARGSQDGFAAFLNKQTSSTFDHWSARWVDQMKQGLLTSEEYAAKQKGLATLLNHMSGQATGKWLDSHAASLSALFFAPRLTVSRVETVIKDPIMLLRMRDADLAKEYARDIGAFVGAGVTGLYAAHMMGADVELDPRSTEFGKIKIGNTRIDFWGGYQQLARYTAQFVTGERKTEAGDITDASRGGSVWKFLRTKAAPVSGALSDILAGNTVYGGDLLTAPNVPYADKWGNNKAAGVLNMVLSRFVPLFAQDVIAGFAQDGLAGGLKTLPAFLGVGAMTYQSDVAKSKEDYSNATGLPWGGPGGDPISEKTWKQDHADVFSVPGSDSSKVTAEFYKAKAANDEMAITGKGPDGGVYTIADWRESRKAYNQGLAISMQALLADLPKKEAESEKGRWIQTFADTFQQAKAESGVMDMNKLEALQAEWLAKNGMDALDYVQQMAKVGRSPIEQQYMSALNQLGRDGYFTMEKYRGMVSGLSDDELDGLVQDVLSARSNDPEGLGKLTFDQSAAIVLGARGDIPHEAIGDVQHLGGGQVSNKYLDPEYWVYKERHPELLAWFNPHITYDGLRNLQAAP